VSTKSELPFTGYSCADGLYILEQEASHTDFPAAVTSAPNPVRAGTLNASRCSADVARGGE
jgi:hypothetical protein